jgi:hypothetical protein
MPDLIQNKQPRTEFRNYNANFLNIHITARTWPLVTSSVWFTKQPPWWQTFRWWWRGWNRGAEVVETTVKRLLCWVFRRTGKAMRQVYSMLVEDMSRNICFFSGSNITCCIFYIHLWAIYWLSLVCMLYIQSFTMPNIIPCLENLGALMSHNPMDLHSLL